MKKWLILPSKHLAKLNAHRKQVRTNIHDPKSISKNKKPKAARLHRSR